MNNVQTLDNYFSHNRLDVAQFLPRNLENFRILDIGCGAGTFRSNISDKCEYWGIEPSILPAKHAMSKLDFVLIGTFESVFNQLPDNYFDLIICASNFYSIYERL